MTLTTFIIWLALALRAFALSPVETAFIVGDDPRADCKLVRFWIDDEHGVFESPYCTFRSDTKPRVAGANNLEYVGLRLEWRR